MSRYGQKPTTPPKRPRRADVRRAEKTKRVTARQDRKAKKQAEKTARATMRNDPAVIAARGKARAAAITAVGGAVSDLAGALPIAQLAEGLGGGDGGGAGGEGAATEAGQGQGILGRAQDLLGGLGERVTDIVRRPADAEADAENQDLDEETSITASSPEEAPAPTSTGKKVAVVAGIATGIAGALALAWWVTTEKK